MIDIEQTKDIFPGLEVRLITGKDFEEVDRQTATAVDSGWTVLTPAIKLLTNNIDEALPNSWIQHVGRKEAS